MAGPLPGTQLAHRAAISGGDPRSITRGTAPWLDLAAGESGRGRTRERSDKPVHEERSESILVDSVAGFDV